MRTLEFLRAESKWLLAPFLMTLSSSFGQTFFIGIFGAAIMAEFGLTNGQWGSIYSLGTLASAITLISIGGAIDRYKLRHLTIAVIIGFVFAASLMMVNPVWWLLPFAIFGLRFCGQGMMSNLSQVTVARWFTRNRGKAVSFTSLGYTLGEATLPILFAIIITSLGWRLGWGVAAIIIACFGLFFALLLTDARQPRNQSTQSQAGMFGRHWTRGEMLRHWLFWVAIPAFLTLPLFNTVLFFQITHFAKVKGLALTEVTLLFPFYTTATVVSSLVFGNLIDRLGTWRIMGGIFVPAALGYFAMSAGHSSLAFASGFILNGLSLGAFAAFSGVFWADYYGTKHLGTIRSTTAALGVLASAIGPALSGILITAGVPYEAILAFMGIYALCASAIFAFIGWRTRNYLVTNA